MNRKLVDKNPNFVGWSYNKLNELFIKQRKYASILGAYKKINCFGLICLK